MSERELRRVAIVLGFRCAIRLRCALNGPHKARPRASLRRTPQRNPQKSKKGDISNEVSMGTFLTRFDSLIRFI